MYNPASYLIHYGIKGQQWGVRRYQNEDGTLTEEGKARYLQSYGDIERKADEDIARAKMQLADIEKNGFNARSAFTKNFKKDSERNLGRKLDDEDLEFFKNTFKEDLRAATMNKQAAIKARRFLEDNMNATFDDIVENSRNIDKENKNNTSFKNSAETIAKELGLESKKKDDRVTDNGDGTSSIKIDDYNKETKRKINENYSPREMKETVESIIDYFNKNGVNIVKELKNTTTGKSFSDVPIDEQFYILMKLFDNDAFDDLD